MLWIAASLAAAGGLCAQADSGSPPPVPAAIRMPWTRGGELFARQWIVLGPVFGKKGAASAGIDPSVRPVDGQSLAVGSNPPLKWIAHKAWQDVTNLRYNPGFFIEASADPATEESAYAYTTFACERDGDWELSLGIDGIAEAWVNGSRVAGRSAAYVFSPDELRIPVRLKAGNNDILLRFTRTSNPWRFVMRVAPSGAVLDPSAEITPYVAPGAVSGDIPVRTDIVDDPAAAPVLVEALAAGGRVVGKAEGARGAVVDFPTLGWPDGAYEFRCTTKTAWGQSWVAYVPWYKGDAIAAARKLDAAAREAGTDTAGQYVRMLADLVRSRVGGSLDTATPAMAMRIHAALLEYEELKQERAGGPGPVHAGGFVRLAYADPADGSTQYCRVYLPTDYDPTRHWPAVVFLHGYNGSNPPYINYGEADGRHSALADNWGVIEIYPHGRGNAGYMGIGEEDVLRCLGKALQRFPIDENRVYLAGMSMGGGGAWRIASRHPDLFAAASPVYGGWDNRVVPSAEDHTMASPPQDPFQAFIEERDTTFTSVENLINLPLYVHHGDADRLVNVENSRHIVRMLQRWGYDVRYREHVGQGHEDLKERADTLAWMLVHRRDSAPRRVRLRAADLGAAAAYWLRIDQFEEPVRLIVADAEFVRPGLLRLDTDNAAAVSLAVPPALRGSGPTLTVVWNGKKREIALQDGRATLVSQEGDDGAGPHKTRRLEGPLTDFVTTPFAVIVGTISGDPAMRDCCREKGAEFSRLWEAWQHEKPRLMNDRDVTPEDEKQFSLLLIGGPDANLVSRQISPGLPFAVSPGAISVDGRTWPVSDAVLEMIYPSPRGPNRYIMVAAATSAKGLSSWKPGLWYPDYGYGSTLWDWVIRDGHRFAVPKEAAPDPGWVAAGVFDARWRRDDRWTSLGKPEAK